MNRKALLATVGSVAVVFGAAGVAVAATTHFAPPLTRSSAARPAAAAPARPRTVTVYVDDPPAVAPTLPPAVVGGAAPEAPKPAPATPVRVTASAAAATEAQHTPAPSEPGEHTAPPAAVTTITTAPVATPQCSGSDDGMTEAQKQAREAACQGSRPGGDG